jgi:hypothetical protein
LLIDGIPQGSILGPLLFLLYVNDIPNAVSNISNPALYADDTILINTNSYIKMLEKDVNTAILHISKGFYSNLLWLYFEKT